MPAITTRDLTKKWTDDAGLFDLDLEVEPGTIVALIGPSGSGKTTTVRLCTGLIEPDSGSVELLGEAPASMSHETRLNIGYLPQENVLYPTLTIRENLALAASIYGIARRDRAEAIDRALGLVDLADVDDRRMSESSGGMRRRASLAAALIHRPAVLFLDEPTAGLDPVLRKAVWDHFASLKDEGTALVVTTQYVGEAAYCDQVGVLNGGRLLALMAPDDLRSHAYGGELLEVSFDAPPRRDALDAMAARVDGSFEATGPRTVVFTVQDAGTASPVISSIATEHGVTVTESERILPEFDDVFVEIVSRA